MTAKNESVNLLVEQTINLNSYTYAMTLLIGGIVMVFLIALGAISYYREEAIEQELKIAKKRQHQRKRF